MHFSRAYFTSVGGCLSSYISRTALESGAVAVVRVEMNWWGTGNNDHLILAQDTMEGIFLRMETSRRAVYAA